MIVIAVMPSCELPVIQRWAPTEYQVKTVKAKRISSSPPRNSVTPPEAVPIAAKTPPQAATMAPRMTARVSGMRKPRREMKAAMIGEEAATIAAGTAPAYLTPRVRQTVEIAMPTLPSRIAGFQCTPRKGWKRDWMTRAVIRKRVADSRRPAVMK